MSTYWYFYSQHPGGQPLYQPYYDRNRVNDFYRTNSFCAGPVYQTFFDRTNYQPVTIVIPQQRWVLVPGHGWCLI